MTSNQEGANDKLANIFYIYDKIGRISKETIGKKIGKKISKSYEYINYPNGTSCIEVIYSNGYRLKNVYDSLGRIIEKYSLSHALQNQFYLTNRYEYNILNKLTKETHYNLDNVGNTQNQTISYKYDALGREIEVTNPDEVIKYTEYDDVNLSQTTMFTASTGEKSPISIIQLNLFKKPKLITLQTPNRIDFNKKSNLYDNFGRLIQEEDVNKNIIRYEYYLNGNKSYDIYSNGKKIYYIYDILHSNKVTEKWLINNNSGENILLGKREYNEFGDLVKDIDSTGKSIQYFYDHAGNVIKYISRSGKIINFYYDYFNNLIRKEILNDVTPYSIEYQYDINNRLQVVKDNLGSTRYEYYLDGRLKKLVYPDNKTIYYNYNLQGSLTEIRDIEGNRTRYYFDSINGKLIKSEFIRTQGEIISENYEYDKLGRLKKTIMPNGTYIIYSYNEMNHLQDLSYFSIHHQGILTYSYLYYKDFNIKQRVRNDGVQNISQATERYFYDEINNLKEYTCTGDLCPKDKLGYPISAKEYTFDSLNNIKTVNVKLIVNSHNAELMNENKTTYFYSNQDPRKLIYYTNSNPFFGKLKSETIEYDEDGNIVRDDEGNLLFYNSFNRLLSFEKNTQKTEYTYDGNGNLIAQKSHNGNNIKFYYSDNKILNEVQDANTNSYFLSNDKIVAKFSNLDINGQFYIKDQGQNFIKIMEGDILLPHNYVYSPYGTKSDLSFSKNENSSSAILNKNLLHKNNLGFNGERTDPQTGYYFLGKGYRAYNPMLHRFMQYDAFSPFEKGGINGYTFAENNPIMKFDPTGESAQLTIGLSIGLGIVDILLSIFTLGIATGPISTGFAITAGVLSAVSMNTGLAGGIMERKAEIAHQSGNKEFESYYSGAAKALGWSSLAISIASGVGDVGISAVSATSKLVSRLDEILIRGGGGRVGYGMSGRGAASNAVAGGPLLHASEGFQKGHTISRHVNVNRNYLRSRGIPVASRFIDLATAEYAINDAIMQNTSQITHWLQYNRYTRLNADATTPYTVGEAFISASNSFVFLNSTRTVLEYAPGWIYPYRLVTAYPF